jgi:hypothetical protein
MKAQGNKLFDKPLQRLNAPNISPWRKKRFWVKRLLSMATNRGFGRPVCNSHAIEEAKYELQSKSNN